MKTRSAQVQSPWKTRVVDVELPEPGVGQALIEVKACGVCGTDLTAAMKDERWHPFGHEVAGEVRAVGHGVNNIKPGDQVVLESASYCGTCDVCRSGRVDLCNKGANFWGQPALGFSDRMIAPAGACVRYEQLAPEVACLAEPAGVAFDMVRTAGIQLADRVAVIGIGPIGLAAVALAIHGGASQVTAIAHGHSRARIELARRMGAKVITVDASTPMTRESIGEFEHVLCTAPVDVLPQAMSLLTFGGILTYVGIGTGNPVISFDANAFHFRKLQLRSSFASPAIYYPQVLRMLAAGVIPGDQLISHRYALGDIQQALDTCRDDKETTLKVVITNGSK